MQQLRREKSFKAKDPFETIDYIRQLLKKYNIFLSEKNSKEPGTTLYSSRVKIDDERLGDLGIGSNGKGLSSKYSLASAYSEFMERLQNGILIERIKYATTSFLESNPVTETYKERLASEDLKLDFCYAPDEKVLSYKELIDRNGFILRKMLKVEGDLSPLFAADEFYREMLCLPFYDVREETAVYLPVMLLFPCCGSNGMCAGNITEEALIQGICEIFERYALKKIYREELTPPTIPLEYFKGTAVYENIENFTENKHISITIKDCSLGVGLPVIGVLFIDHSKNKYNFHLGSDPSPITALERCFTEAYQGERAAELKYKYSHFTHDPFTNHEQTRDRSKEIHFSKSKTSGNGKWPTSIFMDGESYPFNGFPYPVSSSDREDLQYLVDNVFQLGSTVLIRDVSYLGFPSFFVYIPGMSEVTFKDGLPEVDTKLAVTRNLPVLFNMKNASTGELEKLTDAIDRFYRTAPEEFKIQNYFLHNTNKDIEEFVSELFVVMLNYRVGNLDRCIEYINKYFDTIPESDYENQTYFLAARDFFNLKKNGISPEGIKRLLELYYGEEGAGEILEDFSDPQQAFKNVKLPTCFNCDACEIKPDCRFFEIVKLVKSLQEEYKKNTPDQLALKKVFGRLELKSKRVG